ncbi:MAG: hypothetical protein AB1403_11305 [Candidatus Riflebacteria bacterium]
MADTPFLDEIIDEGEGGIPTTELWEEIRDNLGGGGGTTPAGQKGSVTLGGSAGVAVTISDVGSTDYDIFYFVENGAGAGSIGEITFRKDSSTQFTVFNSGSDVTSVLRYWVVPSESSSVRGTVTLAGNSGVAVTIPDMGSTDYDVFWWLSNGAGAGSVGEITLSIDSATQFTVFNSGSDTTSTLNYWAVTR